jgi:hypothetical protein
MGARSLGKSAAERSRLESARAAELLAQHPRGAAIEALLGGARLVAGSGATAFAGVAGTQRAPRLLAALFVLFLAALYLGAAAGGFHALRDGRTASLVFLSLFPAYLQLISSGPEATTRFRVPMAPFLAALAGFGWSRPRSH